MGKKVDEPKQKYSFTAKPSIVDKAKRKIKKEKISFSQKMENILYEISQK